MGTRSLTHVIATYKDSNNKKSKTTLLTMYRQFDGYPSGMGADLVEFLEGSRVVNGLGMDDINSKRVFNGAGCLAAQLVAHFKQGAGSFYIEPPNAKNCGEEYTYDIEVDSDTREVTLRCYEIGYMNKKNEYVNKKRILFEGKAEAFLEAVKENQYA